MKKYFVIFILTILAAVAISACASQHKCAAYGYYSEHCITPSDSQQL